MGLIKHEQKGLSRGREICRMLAVITPCFLWTSYSHIECEVTDISNLFSLFPLQSPPQHTHTEFPYFSFSCSNICSESFFCPWDGASVCAGSVGVCWLTVSPLHFIRLCFYIVAVSFRAPCTCAFWMNSSLYFILQPSPEEAINLSFTARSLSVVCSRIWNWARFLCLLARVYTFTWLY